MAHNLLSLVFPLAGYPTFKHQAMSAFDSRQTFAAARRLTQTLGATSIRQRSRTKDPTVRYLLLSLLLLVPGFATAGAYSDDVAKCMVSGTSPKDKAELVRWIFSIAALHPELASISTVSPDTRSELNRGTAKLVERLITDTCRVAVQDAIRYEGPAAIEASFNVLGQVAMRELMTDQKVKSGFEAFAQYIDKAKFEALGIK